MCARCYDWHETELEWQMGDRGPAVIVAVGLALLVLGMLAISGVFLR